MLAKRQGRQKLEWMAAPTREWERLKSLLQVKKKKSDDPKRKTLNSMDKSFLKQADSSPNIQLESVTF